MSLRTLIARVADGLILCESDEERGRVTPELKQQAAQLVTKLHSFPQRATVEAGEFTYHLAIGGGVCILCLFDRNYPRTVAFALLDEMFEFFHEELKRKFGTGSVDYGSQVDCLEVPYSFGTFGRQLSRASAEYKDPTRGKALKMLHADISNLFILQTTVNEVLRDEILREDVKARARKQSSAGSGKAALLYSPFKWLWGNLLLVIVAAALILLACDALVYDVHTEAQIPVACFIFVLIIVYVIRSARSGGKAGGLVSAEMLDMLTEWNVEA